MRSYPLSPADVLRALELFGPQARPYNFDDCFDCWGFVRRVFEDLDDGFEMDEELGPAGDLREAAWVAFGGPDEDLLHDDSRFAIAVWARGPGGFSAPASAPFLYRPASGNPLLAYDPIRPEGLHPDGRIVVPAGEDVRLIREPELSQAGATVTVFEDACLLDGHIYSWYVSARASDGRTAFAPAEGVFAVSGEG